MKLKYFLNKIQDVKIKDYCSLFPMTIALIIKPFYKKTYKDAWLICEEPKEARDNGYHFFQYMVQNQPNQKCFYAIKKKSIDYKKVKKYGNIIEYGSIQHWLAYFLCQYNISSQKGGKPNAAVCSFMELTGFFQVHNIFLQHGVIINDLKWLYSDCSKIEKFITSTIPETKFVEQKFGYPKGTVCLTGIPRFDALHDLVVENKQILIMPTWRCWFNLRSKKNSNINSNFEESEYLNKWKELLNNDILKELIEKKDLKVIFYLHRNLQNHINSFKNINSKIILASWEKYDIQELLKSSALMVTDYSSVFFDMIYMKKPIVFYQFDEDEYRKYQYGEGYFDYHNNNFGNSYAESWRVVKELKTILENDCKISPQYLDSHKEIFRFYDRKNSERVFKILKEKE